MEQQWNRCLSQWNIYRAWVWPWLRRCSQPEWTVMQRAQSQFWDWYYLWKTLQCSHVIPWLQQRSAVELEIHNPWKMQSACPSWSSHSPHYEVHSSSSLLSCFYGSTIQLCLFQLHSILWGLCCSPPKECFCITKLKVYFAHALVCTNGRWMVFKDTEDSGGSQAQCHLMQLYCFWSKLYQSSAQVLFQRTTRICAQEFPGKGKLFGRGAIATAELCSLPNTKSVSGRIICLAPASSPIQQALKTADMRQYPAVSLLWTQSRELSMLPSTVEDTWWSLTHTFQPLKG